MRAFADTRLTRTHLAVLGVISRFDGFGRNGAGCYATQDTIAKLAACNRETVNKRVSDLISWQYLEANRQKNRRRLHYRVVHDTCPTGHMSLAANVTAGTPIDPENMSCGSHKEITHKGLRDAAGKPLLHPHESSERYSPEGARRVAVPAPPHARRAISISQIDEPDWWAYLAQLRRFIGDNKPLADEQVEQVDAIVLEFLQADLEYPSLDAAFNQLAYHWITEDGTDE